MGINITDQISYRFELAQKVANYVQAMEMVLMDESGVFDRHARENGISEAFKDAVSAAAVDMQELLVSIMTRGQLLIRG